MLEEFPSQPKKDGTKDKEHILAKQRREAREAEEAKAEANGGCFRGGEERVGRRDFGGGDGWVVMGGNGSS